MRNYFQELREFKIFNRNWPEDYVVRNQVQKFAKTGDIGFIPEACYEMCKRMGWAEFYFTGLGALRTRMVKNRTVYDEELERRFEEWIYGNGTDPKSGAKDLNDYPFYVLYWHYFTNQGNLKVTYKTVNENCCTLVFEPTEEKGKILVATNDYCGFIPEYRIRIYGQNVCCNNFRENGSSHVFKTFEELWDLAFTFDSGHVAFYSGSIGTYDGITFLSEYKKPKAKNLFSALQKAEAERQAALQEEFLVKAENALFDHKDQHGNSVFDIQLSDGEYVDLNNKGYSVLRGKSKRVGIKETLADYFDISRGFKCCFEAGKLVFYCYGCTGRGLSTIRCELIMKSSNKKTNYSACAYEKIKSAFIHKGWSIDYLEKINTDRYLALG